MLEATSFYINKKFISTIWFRFIFLTFNYLFFYLLSYQSATISKVYGNLPVTSANLRFFSQVPYLFEPHPFFKFLDQKFLVIYTNSFESASPFVTNSFISLQCVSFNGYFINNTFLHQIYNYYDFFQQNYLFYKAFLFYFVNFFFEVIRRLKFVFVFQIPSLRKYCK